MERLGEGAENGDIILKEINRIDESQRYAYWQKNQHNDKDQRRMYGGKSHHNTSYDNRQQNVDKHNQQTAS